MGTALLAAALTGVATGVGAFPFFFLRQLSRRAYDGVLGLGAGLMLAAATLGLLAEALELAHHADVLQPGRLLMIVAGFLSGVVVAAAMDRLIPHRHARGHHQHIHGASVTPGHHHEHADHGASNGHDLRRTYLIIGALSIHRVPEGLAIGAGFAATSDARLGWLLAVTVAVQNVCEGVVMGAPLRHAGVSPWRGLLVVLLSGSAVPLGAAIGLLAGALTLLPFVLALAAGTLIYVTSNEVIPESHSHGHEGTASAGLVTGFLLTMLLQAVFHA
jgi:zinc transporter, ZIP family